ncbi:MAG: hypothetical protein MJ094_00475 [Saccharofermentans sp.]|nr:hypothetical protein [Saccharofermentans sp.]
MHGKVLYRDVFDHKGPAFLMLYGIFDAISNRNYFGEWLLFFISTFSFLIAVFKTGCFYLKKITALFVTSLATVLLYLKSSYYISCGTPEELLLPLYMWGIFFILAIYKKIRIPINNCFIALFLGVSTSFVLLAKLNLVVFWGLASIIVFILLYKDTHNFPFKETLFWLLGFFIVLTPIVIYFIATDSLKSFFDAYIVFNIRYASDGNDLSFLIEFFHSLYILIRVFPIHMMILLIGVISACLKKITKPSVVLVSVVVFLLTVLGEVSSGRVYYYSILPCIPFVYLCLILSMINIEKLIARLSPSFIIITSFLVTITSVILNGGFLYSRLFNPEISGIEKTALRIQELYTGEGNPAVFQYAYSANGVYTFLDAYPEVFYFYVPGDSSDNYTNVFDEQIGYMENGIPEFCVCASPSCEYDWKLERYNSSYHFIDRFEQNSEGTITYISLYQRID